MTIQRGDNTNDSIDRLSRGTPKKPAKQPQRVNSSGRTFSYQKKGSQAERITDLFSEKVIRETRDPIQPEKQIKVIKQTILINETKFLLPTQKQLTQADYYPYKPYPTQQGDNKTNLKGPTKLNGIKNFSQKRKLGEKDTANTRFIYKTIINKKEYFAKIVSMQVALGAKVIEKIAQQLHLNSHMLPTTYIQLPDSNSAILVTPLISGQKDVNATVLKKSFGSKLNDFLIRMAIFDHIISNKDRGGIKQMITDGKGAIYLIDNDDSLEQLSPYFEPRTNYAHIIELYSEELDIIYKNLEIGKDIICATEKMLTNIDSFVSHINDMETQKSIKNSLGAGLLVTIQVPVLPHKAVD